MDGHAPRDLRRPGCGSEPFAGVGLLPAGQGPQQVGQAVEVGHDLRAVGHGRRRWRGARPGGRRCGPRRAGPPPGSAPGTTNSVGGSKRSVDVVDEGLERGDHLGGDQGGAGGELVRGCPASVASSAISTHRSRSRPTQDLVELAAALGTRPGPRRGRPGPRRPCRRPRARRVLRHPARRRAARWCRRRPCACRSSSPPSVRSAVPTLRAHRACGPHRRRGRTAQLRLEHLPVALTRRRPRRLPRPRARAGRRLRRRHRHLAADRRTSPPTTSAGPALEGCNEILVRHPARRHRRPARRLLRGRRRRRRDRHLRRLRRRRSAEYGIADRAHEINAGRRPHRPRGGRRLLHPRPPRWVAGSHRPGHQVRLARPDPLRRAARRLRGAGADGLLEGGVDLLIIETPVRPARRPRPPSSACRRAMAAVGRAGARSRSRSPSSSPAACCSAPRSAPPSPPSTPLRPDVIGINCATGPAEMSEHLRHLSPARPDADLRACPTPACPSVVDGKMHYDLTPDAAGRAPRPLRHRARRVRSSAAAAAPRPSTSSAVVERVRATSTPAPRARPTHEPAVASIYTPRAVRPGRRRSWSIGERTNANGSKKFREAMLDGDWDTCVGHGHASRSRRAPTSSTSASTTSARDGTADMDEIASRFATQATRPARARLHRAAGHRGRPAVDRRPGHPQLGQPRGRRRRRAPGSTGSSRWPGSTAPPSSASASTRRARPAPPSGSCGWPSASTTSPSSATAWSPSDLIFDALAFPLVDRLEESRRRRHRDHRGHPAHQGGAARACCTIARPLQRVASASTRPPATSSTRCSCTSAQQAGLDAAIVHAARIMPLNQIARRAARGLPRPHLRPARPADGYDPLQPSCSTCSRTCSVGRGREGGPHRLAGRAAPRASASSTATATASTADLDEALAEGIAAARHHQRRTCSAA